MPAEPITLMAFGAAYLLTLDKPVGPVSQESEDSQPESPSTDAPITYTGDGDISVTGDWLTGYLVSHLPFNPTWYGGKISGPIGVVWHYTDTGPNAVHTMARNRSVPYNPSVHRISSWHITIEQDGAVYQHIPFSNIAHHAGGDGAVRHPELGWANACTVGIELVGRGDYFSPIQVASAGTVLYALRMRYDIPQRLAMVQHSELNPSHRRDPGPVWMGQHADTVISLAYGYQGV